MLDHGLRDLTNCVLEGFPFYLPIASKEGVYISSHPAGQQDLLAGEILSIPNPKLVVPGLSETQRYGGQKLVQLKMVDQSLRASSTKKLGFLGDARLKLFFL